jgi:hypothetical protein
MPLRVIDGRQVVVCVNQLGPPPEQVGYVADVARLAQGPIHRMSPMHAWGSLDAVLAPLAPNLPAQPTRSMIPLKIYACDVCGYVELYLGSVVDPGIWRHG